MAQSVRGMVTITASPKDTASQETKDILYEMGPQFLIRIVMGDPPANSIMVGTPTGGWLGYLLLDEVTIEQRPGTEPSTYLERKLNPGTPLEEETPNS